MRDAVVSLYNNALAVNIVVSAAWGHALAVYIIWISLNSRYAATHPHAGARVRNSRTTTTGARPRAKPRLYTVKSSDTSLDSIARKTGIPTSRLLELNPSLDPQTLVPGQQIKLRQ